MARRTSLRINITLRGYQETLDRFRELPKQASDELRDQSQQLAESLASRIKQAAESDRSPQARLFAPTVRARRDRVPQIVAGGAKRVGRRRVPVWGILFGAEFGSNRHPQFGKPHAGQNPNGPVFGVVEREREEISRAWNEAADNIIARFTQGGAR